MVARALCINEGSSFCADSWRTAFQHSTLPRQRARSLAFTFLHASAGVPHAIVPNELPQQSTHAHTCLQVMVQHALPSHLRALKKFLLVGQGDFVTTLLDTVGVELGTLLPSIISAHLSSV